MLATELQIAESTIAQPAPDNSFLGRWPLPVFAGVLCQLHVTEATSVYSGEAPHPAFGHLLPAMRGEGAETYCAWTYVGSVVCWSITEPYAVTEPAPSMIFTLTLAL